MPHQPIPQTPLKVGAGEGDGGIKSKTWAGRLERSGQGSSRELHGPKGTGQEEGDWGGAMDQNEGITQPESQLLRVPKAKGRWSHMLSQGQFLQKTGIEELQNIAGICWNQGEGG